MTRRAQPDAGTSRRAFLLRVGALGAAVTLGDAVRALAAVKRADGNVLFLLCDALRADRLGCYGYRRLVDGVERSITPVMDSIAASGVLYENCIAQSSWTQTSMLAISYSAWPVLKGNAHTFDYVPPDFDALKLATPGYNRIALNSNPYLAEPIYTRQYDEYKTLRSQDYVPARAKNDDFDWMVGKYIRAAKPLFAYIHYMDPHEPYNFKHSDRGRLAPKGWYYLHPLVINERLAPWRDDTGRVTAPEPEDLARQVAGTGDAYDEDIMYLDRALTQLQKLLVMYEIADRTTIILTADHGQAFGEHGWVGHKQSLYQEEIRVPLIISGPGLPKGVRVKAQVRSVDILPTVAALSGTSVSGYVGRPLLPAERVEAEGNRLAYACCDYAKYNGVERLLTCIVTPERMKYIRVLTTDRKLLREELYDLSADPCERRDLAAAQPETIARLRAEMDAFEARAYWRPSPGAAPKADNENRDQLRALGYTGS